MNPIPRIGNRRRRIRIIVVGVVALLLSTLVAVPASDASSGRVYRGYHTYSGKHYRKSQVVGDGMGWTNIHFAIMAACDFNSAQLATAAKTYSNRLGSWHYLSVAAPFTNTMNAGSHHFYSDGGTQFWSPGGQNGWDKCY